MLEEYAELFHDIEINIDEILRNSHQFSGEAVGIPDAVRQVLSDALVDAGNRAIEQVEELQYPPLKERLLENLRKPEHVEIFGNTIELFNEEIAGTYNDLLAGQETAGGGTGTPQAPAVWKYGIYLPHLGQGWQRKSSRMELPTYEEVIGARLDAWGDKAPYWYFLENGNAGNGRAFPNFSGTSFIAGLRGKVTDILARAKKLFEDHLIWDLDELIKIGIFVNPKSRTRVTIYRYSVGATHVAIQKTSAGNFFYRLGQKYYTVDEFQKMVKNFI